MNMKKKQDEIIEKEESIEEEIGNESTHKNS